MRRPHLCFVSANLYPVLVGSTEIQFAGGAEVQQAVVCRALQRAGCRVSILSRDFGQPAHVEHDGLSLHRLPSQGQRGWRGLRFVHPRLTDVADALRQIDPEIVYFRVAGALAAPCAWYARRHGKRMVYAAASDSDFSTARCLPSMTWRDTVLFRIGLRGAHGVIVQNLAQQAMLRSHFRRDATLCPNCYEEAQTRAGDPRGPIIWVGTVRALKRPDLFMQLARSLPNQRFVMLGGAGPSNEDRRYYERITAEARTLPNLDFPGFVPFARIGQYFDGASLLVNTSEFEGFPNTFLQAWLRGVPTVSFVEPQVQPGKTGTQACKDLAQMTSTVARLTRDSAAWDAASAACRTYFASHHSVDAAVARYLNLFESLNRH